MSDEFIVKRADQSLKRIKAKIYLQDPLVAATSEHLGIHEINATARPELPGEAVIGPGPTSARVTVVDYNADLERVFEPVQPLKSGEGFNVGRRTPLHNLKFHQVNVWAVVTRTLLILEHERVFGRRIPWAFDSARLTILPHAGYWENAFYDRGTGALHFFYFEGRDGEPVYTCLSHDIITHELGHAVLDGLKPYYNEITSPATAGFHESFGDATALTAALSHRPIVVEVAGRRDVVAHDNIISGIADQFGAAVADSDYGAVSHDYLRSARNRLTMDDVKGVTEEHAYSEVLTGTYYDVLQALYEQDLARRLAKAGLDKPDGGIRVRALMRAAEVTGRMMLRALDYCPPVDIDYLDYAQAVVKADSVAYPLDERGYRATVKRAFVQRRIADSEVDLDPTFQMQNDVLRDLDVEKLASSHTDAYDFVNANRSALEVPPTSNVDVINVYRTHKVSSGGFRPPQEIIVEFIWREELRLDGPRFGPLAGSTMPLWCGGTLVFSRDGNILHYILKQDTDARRAVQRDYVADLVRRGHVGVDDGERGFGARSSGATSVVAHLTADGVRLERTAAFRHQDRATPPLEAAEEVGS